ncbi:MAG: hypothetical protein WA432_04115 [Candidatus Babeliaceae bacterium]
MKFRSFLGIIFSLALGFVQNQLFGEKSEIGKAPLIFERGDSYFKCGSKFSVESFYGKGTAFLNDENGDLDKTIIPIKYTIDFNIFYGYGRQTFGYDVITFEITARSKATGGDPDSIASTGETPVKIGSIVTGAHTHSLQRLFPWIRQLEFIVCLTDAFGIPSHHKHYFTAGLFPFELGRGITLGSAYAVDPDVLGYYSDKAIDQYAPGFLFSGELVENDCLNYDVYVGILDNRSDTFDNVNLAIRGHQFGHQLCQARGFGVFDYLIAARLKWKAYDHKGKTLTFEPYALYNNDREQKVTFLGDASSKLGTFGLGVEYMSNRFEGGFEIARNVGHQKVKGVDKDSVELENRNGQLFFVHSDVCAIANNPPDQAGQKAVDTCANQVLIESVRQNSSQNGQQIDSSNLKNSCDRFRNPYCNTFKGSMFIADASYWIKPGKFKISYAIGYASGDESPHKTIHANEPIDCDGDYKGFIGLQEKYAGSRVKSAFLLGGLSKVPRLLTVPEIIVPGDPFPLKVARFTNLIFTGGGFVIKAQGGNGPWNINPNILSYWNDNETRFGPRSADGKFRRAAHRHLGLELNVFAETMLLPDLKLYTVFGLFIAGNHYKDLKGIPLNKDQRKYLNSLNNSDNQAPKVPVLGDDKAYFFNAGFEYRF